MLRLASLSLAAALAIATACQGEDGGGEATEAAAAPAAETGSPAAASAAEVQYDEGTTGLEALMADLKAALAAGDDAATARLLASLRLPDYEQWFAATFGERLAERLAADYRPHHEEIGLLADVLGPELGAESVAIRAERFLRAGDPAATGYQSAALAAMKDRAPLYSVRFSSGGEVFHLWSFVHEGGTFRYVGKLTAAADQRPPPTGRDPLELRLRDADSPAR